jgi:cation diffusion facilitator CzcD-associated flavoprotein CzcO
MGDAGANGWTPSVSRIAIIGAGPVGISCAKYLVAENAFSQIDIYEQRSRVGGIWNLSEPVKSRHIPIPQTDPRYGHHKRRNGKADISDDAEPLEFESPLYDYLETNIPKELMAFSDKPFPEDEPLFPTHGAVLRYLEDYADEVKTLIRFNTAVRDIHPVRDEATRQEQWDLIAHDLETSETLYIRYDAIVVANGHYTVPYVPDVAGIKDWNKAYPGTIIHSKAYRRPEDFSGQKVVVIGNSASGLDIAAQIGKHCRTPVLLSSRSVSAFGTMDGGGYREDVDEIVEFLSPVGEAQRAVRFKSGRIEKDIDAIVFATGYFYSYPFLSNITPPVAPDGLRTRNTFEHLFSIHHPTLAFPVINLKVIPFPLSQNQAAVIARVWSGRLKLPSVAEMEDWEQKVIGSRGNGKYFHLKKFPEDSAQINQLFEWAMKADNKTGLDNEGRGKLGVVWNERLVWMRSRFPDIKAAYMAKGKDRFKIRRVEDLGFDFDKWRDGAEHEDLEMFQQARCTVTQA